MDVTVIIATHGEPEWYELGATRAMPSALRQTLMPADVINIHDDTLHDARNAGARLADTEWLCFLDADDELHPGYLEAMAAGTADLRGPAVQYIAPDGFRNRPVVIEAMPLHEGNYLVIGTLVRRAMFLDVGGFRDWAFYEDWCLWQRCVKAGATIEQIPDAVYIAHMREQSRNRAPMLKEKRRMHDAIRRANYPDLYTVDV